MNSPELSYSPFGGIITPDRVWDAESGDEPIKFLTGHTAAVSSVAFGPDGKRIVFRNADRMIRVWDTASPEEVEAEILAEEQGQS